MHAQDNVNLRVLRMLEAMFSLVATSILLINITCAKWKKIKAVKNIPFACGRI